MSGLQEHVRLKGAIGIVETGGILTLSLKRGSLAAVQLHLFVVSLSKS
jgi:hypothetical protein